MDVFCIAGGTSAVVRGGGLEENYEVACGLGEERRGEEMQLLVMRIDYCLVSGQRGGRVGGSSHWTNSSRSSAIVAHGGGLSECRRN